MDENITELSDDEINSRISDLFNKLAIIANLPSMDQSMVDQIYSLIDFYQGEQQRRISNTDDSGVVLDTDELPKKKEPVKKVSKERVIKIPTNVNKVYKNKKGS